jgi:hypothetical protein
MSVSFITNDENLFDPNILNTDTNELEYDELEYGIEEQNLTLNYIDNIKLEQDEIVNPFYIDLYGGNLKSLSWGDIMRNYNSLIIITNANNKKENDNSIHKFFNYKLKKTDLENITGITYFKTTLNIIRNRDHYLKTNIINKTDLNKLFPSGIFNETELVLCIFEMNEDNTRKYCNMYIHSDDIFDVNNNIDIYNYYTNNIKEIKHMNLSDLFKNIKSVEYWTNKENLQINITRTFVDREFNNQRNSSSSEFKVIALRKEQEHNYKVVKQNNNDLYVEDEHIPVKTQSSQKIKVNFVDPSTIIRNNNNKKRTFYSSCCEKISSDFIIELFDNLSNEKIKYDMLNNLLVSKEYCHIIINNKKLLNKSKYIFDKYPHVFKYTVGYAWITFYLEECLARSRATKDSRFVFDIHTASELPVYPYIYSDLKQNPYLTILIDNIELPEYNVYGLNYRSNYDGYGVTDFNTFKRRFNIFATGNPNIDIFAGLDWSNFAVSGSLISACLQKRSQLLDAYVKINNSNEDEGFKQFIKKYYGESDIDLMSNQSNIIDFLNSVQNVYNLLHKNLDAVQQDIRYETVKNFAICITKHFFECYLDDFNKEYGFTKTKEEFEKMSDDMVFKLYVYQKYIAVKNITTKKLAIGNNINNKFITEYMIPNNYENMNIYIVDPDNYDNYNTGDSDVLYYLNDFGKSLPPKDNKLVIKFSENIRYKLFCKNTKIEMFRIKDKDFFGTVARFHFPCVRAYYQGENVYILPSCISAMMTGLNIEYKYFAGIRNPVDIINKYFQRGFGVILNKFEINKLIEYNKNLDESNPLKYKNDSDNEILFGKKNIKNRIYNIPNDVDVGQSFVDISDLNKYYKNFYKTSCVDCTKMTSINKNGNINKYCPSYAELCYEELN